MLIKEKQGNVNTIREKEIQINEKETQIQRR